MTSEIVIIVVVSFFATSLALIFTKRILTALNIVDVPNHRSSHNQETIRGAGIGLLFGVLVAVVIATFLSITEFDTLLLVFIPVFLVSIIGFIEDLRGLSMKIRLLSQITIGFLVGSLFNSESIPLVLWLLLVCLSFTAYVNFANFMDGINGISGLHGCVVGFTFACYGWSESIIWLQFAGLIIASVFLTFLPANFRGPGMFLGDVGSYLLGGAIAVVSIAAFSQGVHWFVILSPLIIYLTDTIFTILNRFRAGESVFEAHRSHIYQKLTSHGLTHLSASLVVTFFTAVASVLGYANLRDAISLNLSITLMILLCIGYISFPLLTRKHRNG